MSSGEALMSQKSFSSWGTTEQALNWMNELLSEKDKSSIQAASNAKSDAEAVLKLAIWMDPHSESESGSLPALLDPESCDFYEPLYFTEAEIQERSAEIEEWAEMVYHAEGVMRVSKAMCEEAGVPVPDHCTHAFFGMESPEKPGLGRRDISPSSSVQ
ncbi:hypothetical protein DFH07DRAFT_951908 [Mycena maculata]|uniref:Uncharacterized protein n=1 Tax=Mycena maculata TaxID=230809 RepID=A0AAD7NUU6_9AGAR|nr:hypothetical protein DFH07DRAFT_951908 [Mycena maculata]